MRDFLLLLTVPGAFDFQAQPRKWRRAIRSMSEAYHLGRFYHLKFAPHDALSQLFPAK